MNLTQTGADSHYANGKLMRQLFDEHEGFLSSTYVAEEVYVQTTNEQRTVDSARAQLDALYGKPLAWPEIDPAFKLNQISLEDDFIMHLKKKNCDRFG